MDEKKLAQIRINQIRYDMALARKKGIDTTSAEWAEERIMIKKLMDVVKGK